MTLSISEWHAMQMELPENDLPFKSDVSQTKQVRLEKNVLWSKV